ncbi:hypothetical protein KC19_3G194300 [Ceratodon purpureus]|uniref:Uncharacterized protein n=1 Tax=Ceratodon purpureus TaxID=3225 RepID=A0A8T0INR6_CERPU|nr:hypothetical protein KC19_3G194300 [Ceratodon purpureus]
MFLTTLTKHRTKNSILQPAKQRTKRVSNHNSTQTFQEREGQDFEAAHRDTNLNHPNMHDYVVLRCTAASPNPSSGACHTYAVPFSCVSFINCILWTPVCSSF